MKTASGTVRAGKVEFEGEPFEEGAKVTVVIEEDSVELSAEEIDELEQAIDEAERGNTVTAEQLFAELRKQK